MSEKLPRPTNIIDAVEMVTHDNIDIKEYPARRFKNLFLDAQNEQDYIRMVTKLIIKSSIEAELQLWKVFADPKKAAWRNLLTIEDLAAEYGKEWGLPDFVVEKAKERAKMFDTWALRLRWSL